MKITLFLLIFTSFLFSNSLIIENDNFGKNYLQKYTQIYTDETSSLNFEEIKNKIFFTNIKNNFTATKNSIWSNFSITNKSDKKIEIFLENEKAGIDIIDIYILKNENFYEKIELGDYRDIKLRELKTKKSTFKLILDENSTYTFFIKYKSYSSISTLWYIYDKESFEKSLNIESIIWGFFIGVVIALCLHNLFVYFSTRDFIFLSYIFVSIFSALYQLSINGIFYQLFENENLKYLSGLNWVFSFTTLIFVIIFHISFLKPKINSFMFKSLFICLLINICVVIFYSFSLEHEELRYAVTYTNFITYLIVIVLFTTTIWAIKDKYIGARFYLFVQLFYFSISFYVFMVLVGYFESFEYFWLVIPIVVLFDIFFLSIALYIKVKEIEKRKKESEQFIISQARFTTMGNNIANMIHQWKNPIAQIGSQIALLESIYKLDKKNFDEAIEQTLPQMKDSILFLNHVMNDIYNFYKNPSSKEYFNIADEIDSLLRILNDEIKVNSITINKNITPLNFYGYKASFLNVLMIILENSIYQLKTFKKQSRKIFIYLEKIDDSQIVLTIEDNGGGIESSHLEKIFDLNYSSKKDKGSGIGLALAKELIEKRLNGKISVENTLVGASFIISLKIGTDILDENTNSY
ncbi:sensor histidine kinase [Aliarcobacter butzleri]|uniref:sensor histidine kinase n=1 Tax=Aliarcobacter butzleri TaxID=28197 RepID=UPI00125FAB7C|nr:sensor histidine kinase [Aliarcobacter butzleri]